MRLRYKKGRRMEKRAWERSSGRTYKAYLQSRARMLRKPDITLGVHDADVDLSNKVSMLCSEKQRGGLNVTEVHLCKSGKDHHDKVGAEAELHLELTDCTQSQLDMTAESELLCAICMDGGKLLCCNGEGCRRSFHLACVNPPLTYVPPGVWHCMWCNERKIKHGLYSVSEGVESILDVRDAVSHDEVMQGQKQYLVKYKGLAHVYSRWIPEAQLVSEAPMLFPKFKKKFQATNMKIEGSIPHRLLDKRLILFPGPHDANNGSDCRYEWLVKWKGLSYDHATWESENAPFLMTPKAMKLIDSFESRHKKSDKGGSNRPKKFEENKNICTELSELPFEASSLGISNCNLAYVNKLREYWNKGRNALIIDDQGDLKHPFLIITKSSALSLWESEFSRWAPRSNIVVVYSGNRDIRASIRTLEFHNENGCIMFQVLLSTTEVVVEDLRLLEPIKWEVIVIDECQCPSISENLKEIKILTAAMKLLLVSHEIQGRTFNYPAVLSFLDSEFDENFDEVGPNVDSCSLKERLAYFVAFECKSGISKFVEFWVPVRLSNVQIEQYCDSLLSNTSMLCSNSKNDSVGSLRDLLNLTRKCCDHPYLVDYSLHGFLTSVFPEADNLEVGINVSGKLQLLDKILSEIKKFSLKVLVMFQSLGGSGQISSIGDILADFVHQRFGEDSYTRIDKEFVRLKLKGAFNMFGQEESGPKFLCLIESRACSPRIKCSSVDVVIIFDSNWNPTNDLRALQKITIDAQFDPVKVLRLYSPFTVEEQILILAKEGNNLDNINRSTSQILLNWGTYYLFDKLDIFHGCGAPISEPKNWSEHSLLEEVFLKLSAILHNDDEANYSTSSWIISYAQQIEGAYSSNIPLFGEVELLSMENYIVIKQLIDNEPPHAFWTNLLEGRSAPRWKYLPGPSARTRKKVQYPIDLPERSDYVVRRKPRRKNLPRPSATKKKKIQYPTVSHESSDSEGDAVENKRRKVVHTTVKLDSQTERLMGKRKISAPPVKKSQVAGVSWHSSGSKCKCFPWSTNNVCDFNHTSETLSMTCVSNDVSPGPNRGDEVTLGEHFTQAEHHSAVITPISGEQLREPSDPSVPPPVQNFPPQLSKDTTVVGTDSDDSHVRSSDIFLESGNNHLGLSSPIISELLQPTCLDPLQVELQRLQKYKRQVIKEHEDTKLRLISDREKQIDEIQKRYDALFQKTEMTFIQQKKDLETREKNVQFNELLAKAMTLKNDSSNALSLGLPKEATISSFLDIMAELCAQPTALVTIPGVEHSSASLLAPVQPMNQSEQQLVPRNEQSLVSLPMAGSSHVTPSVPVMTTSSSGFQQAVALSGLQIQQSNSPSLLLTTPGPVTPPMQPLIHSSPPVHQCVGYMPLFHQSSGWIANDPPATLALQSLGHGSALSANSARPLSMPMPINQSRGRNFYAGDAVRAPAPHLRHSRPSSYVSASSSRLTFPNPQPNFHSQINSQPTSGHAACHSGSFGGVNPQLGRGGWGPSGYGSISSTPELPMDVNHYSASEDLLGLRFPLTVLGQNYRGI